MTLVRGSGLLCLVSVPLLLWFWIMGWLPESASTGAIVTGLGLFSLFSFACLTDFRKK